MKQAFVVITILLFEATSLVASHSEVSGTVSKSFFITQTGKTDMDSIPRVEIDGRLKVNSIPEGSGMQVVTDMNGNLYKSALFLPPGGGHDSLTYTIINGFGLVFPPGTYALEAFSVAAAAFDFTDSGVISSFSKKKDQVSVGFVYLLSTHPSNTIEIEVKVYESGAPMPYFSYKMKNITVLSFAHGTAYGNTGIVESYAIQSEIFGVKNVETGGSLAFSSVTDMPVTY